VPPSQPNVVEFAIAGDARFRRESLALGAIASRPSPYGDPLPIVSFSRSAESGAPWHLPALRVTSFCFPPYPASGNPSGDAARHAKERRADRAGTNEPTESGSPARQVPP